MAQATIRDLRYHFEKVESELARGEEIQITRRGRVVARLLPPWDSAGQRPDFAARLQAMWGERVFPSTTELLEEIRRDKI